MKLDIEPGLIVVLRAFVVVAFGLLSINVVARLLDPGFPHPLAPMAVMLALAAALLLLLVSSRLARWLGAAHLPLALTAASALPFAGLGVALLCGQPHYEKLSLELSLLTLPPLLLIAWQYGLRPAIAFSIATGLLDAAIAIAALSPSPRAEAFSHFFVGRMLAYAATGYIVARLVSEQRAQRATLRRANANLAHFAATRERLAVSHERNRVARELHDTLAHTLSALAVSLEAMRSLWDSEPARARHVLEQSLSTARSGLTETRRALHALRASPVEELGLGPAVVNLAEAAAARGGMELELDLPSLPEELSPDLEECVYRVAQEALANAVRHSGARRVRVVLRTEGDRLVLTVLDDGRGLGAGDAGAGRFGIKGMRERSEMLGGTLELSLPRGPGTKVRMSVPLAGVRP